MPFLRRFDTAPLIQPVLFKAIIYWAAVFHVRFLEKLVEYLFAGGTLSGIPEYVATHFTWHRFAAIQIWIFVLFLLYTSVEELNARLGNGELRKIFFGIRRNRFEMTRACSRESGHVLYGVASCAAHARLRPLRGRKRLPEAALETLKSRITSGWLVSIMRSQFSPGPRPRSQRPKDRFAAEPIPHGDRSKLEVERLPHRR